ncbi:hypothetical protein LSTR_LSTR007078 [Laodelphax striatellus]|uniref:MD-2-related lipid-recognition domain-containing protein n=1 Tax=Laodelphax striatellus TaxID=195883 RepID=A0A482WF80_LAOST|nr:hypothetical protein LSTR_LSTR007078 [Laodelphax striatellus]
MFGIFICCSAENLQLFEGSTLVVTGQSSCENHRSAIIPRETRITKFNRTHYHIFCNFTLPFDLDDNITVDIDVKRKTPSGVVNVIKLSSQLCKVVNRYLQETMKELFEAGGYKIEKCPIPKGSYLWNTVLDMKMKNLPHAPYGDYETTCSFWRGVKRKKVMCFKLYIQIRKKISDNRDDTIFETDKI